MSDDQIKSQAETLENAPDRYVAIREALNMGPTPGPWSFKDNRDGSINLFGDGRLFSPSCRLMNKPANEAYISACDPDTIRELLSERDALASENERLREALEQIEQQLDYGQINMALHITRRALEGGE